MEEKAVILAVDDNSASLTLLSGILRSRYKVYAVSTGEDALSFLAQRRPDLLLLDAEMPGMSGASLLAAIWETPGLRGIPAIFLTGLDDAESETQAFRLGAEDFIRKPINSTVLLARVGMCLERARLRSASRGKGT